VKRIEGRAKTIRELMDKATYTIDFYQREYAWQERQVRELVDDLTGKFLDFYDDGHARHEVEQYGHYFLGPIVISHKRGKRYIVDGQQRLTTLTLLFIYLHHLQADREDIVDIANLVYSEKYGRKAFNLDVPDRTEIMDRLLNGETIDLNGQNESIQNIALRYTNLADHFPEELNGQALPYFVDWLLENVHLVEIEAYSDEDAYTIFETMNDRGLSLSLPEMLKGYILANIRHEDDQRKVNDLWKAHMQAFKDLGEDEDVDFFKAWLRARYAETMRPGKKGAENKDYERVGSEFHRWVRDQRERLGLTDSDAFVRFVMREMDFYAKQALAIRRAASKLTDGLESIRYTEDRGFTMQMQLLLAPLEPEEPAETTLRKIQLVADFLDIWLARRVWNFRTIGQSSVRYTLFGFTRDIRGLGVEDLSEYLRKQLDAQHEVFAANPNLRLHQQNYRQIRHILARMTHWLDAGCGLSSNFNDLVSQGRAKPYEIEHIWANHAERFADEFPSPTDFDLARNRIGGLLLLQQGLNQSIGDGTYEEKRDAYVSHGQNLLARSLHPLAYQNNPAFHQLNKRTGLPFKAYEAFGPEAQQERQELYIRLAEWVWNPSRVGLGELEPPEPQPLGGAPVQNDKKTTRKRAEGEEPFRFGERRAFWTDLLAHAGTKTRFHSNCSPTSESWVAGGSGRSGLTFVYVVLQDSTRVELYISTSKKAVNKAYFDQLHAKKDAVEQALGFDLDWQRLDNGKGSRICTVLHNGGWGDRARWPEAIPTTVDTMIRLRETLQPLVKELTSP